METQLGVITSPVLGVVNPFTYPSLGKNLFTFLWIFFVKLKLFFLPFGVASYVMTFISRIFPFYCPSYVSVEFCNMVSHFGNMLSN